MTFLHPAMLWSFVVLAPLAAIYFLKVRPRRKRTTAYFLWEKIFQERRASSLFQRLRDAWSLLLMLIAAAAVCLALGRPEWADQRKDLLIVIDNSASMAARNGRTTRLESAKRAARDIIQGLNGNQLAAVATIAGRLLYQSHLTDNPRDLLEAVDAIEVTGESLNLRALPTDESDVNRWTRDHRVLLVSDGGFENSKRPNNVELIKVGNGADNVGLVAADMAYVAGSIRRLGFYYQVASTCTENRHVDLTLSYIDENGKDKLFKVIPLVIEPGANSPETFELEDAPAGRWLAKLDMDDALAEDNVAYLAVAAPEPIRVAVESTDRYFLENSVQAFSQGDSSLTLVTEKADVVLAKSTSPDAHCVVIFQPAGESEWWSDLGEEVVVGAARVVVDGHPALRHLDATSIPFVSARQLTPPAGAQILVTDDHGLPLIYKARHDGHTAIVVNLDPVAAEFYFSAWFPVLVHSAATHLVGRENQLAAAYRPGEAVPIPGGRDDITTTVTPPAPLGAAAETSDSPPAAAATRGQWFTGVERLGFYTFSNVAGTRQFGANIFSEAESLLNNESIESEHEPLSRGRSPAHWLTVLAIIVLSGESLLYHRRKVG